MAKKLPNLAIVLALLCAGFSPLLAVGAYNFAAGLRLNQQNAEINSVLEEPAVISGQEKVLQSPTATEPSETYQYQSQLIIVAINPGYKVGDKSEVGELIELKNLSGEVLDLSDFALYYTNGGGTRNKLLDFAPGTKMDGETLVLRYSKSPDRDLSDAIYTTSLALTAGPLEVVHKGEIIDTICWTGKNNCAKAFKSSAPTTLVRNLMDNTFAHTENYQPQFDQSHQTLILPDLPDDDATTQVTPQCYKLEFSEIYSYYQNDKSEQFVELYNPGDQDVQLDACKLGYKNKNYALQGTIKSGEYFAYYPQGLVSFTKNPNSSNTVSLIDADGKLVDELVYLHGQKKSASFAKFYDASGAENWAITYARTPNAENIFQEFRNCEAGKVINPETGFCVKVDNTNSTAKICPAGKYLNPLTGRCKTITQTTKKDCKEGYERNPTSGRCRKIKTPNQGADYAVVPTTAQGKNTFVALGIVIAIVSLGVLYILWQFRREIARVLGKARKRIHHILKNLVARRASRNRHKQS